MNEVDVEVLQSEATQTGSRRDLLRQVGTASALVAAAVVAGDAEAATRKPKHPLRGSTKITKLGLSEVAMRHLTPATLALTKAELQLLGRARFDSSVVLPDNLMNLTANDLQGIEDAFVHGIGQGYGVKASGDINCCCCCCPCCCAAAVIEPIRID